MKILDVPDIPMATTKDKVRFNNIVDPESEVEIDEEILGVAEEVLYGVLTYIEEAMIDAVV